MIDHRAFASLGHADHGWLKTWHHFSFAAYTDPRRMGWGALRVLNADLMAPGSGFAPHRHRAMEIVSIVLSGAITHEDSLGNAGRTGAGGCQVLSAGTGLTHSEWNRGTDDVRVLHFWLRPRDEDGEPRWQTRTAAVDRLGRFAPVASGYAEDKGALPLLAEARICAAMLESGSTCVYPTQAERRIYLVVAKGTAAIGGVRLDEGDGAAITGEHTLAIVALGDVELILVDTV